LIFLSGDISPVLNFLDLLAHGLFPYSDTLLIKRGGVRPASSNRFIPQGTKSFIIIPVCHQAKAVAGQADRIVLNLSDSSVTLEALLEQLTKYPISGLKEVIFINNGQIIETLVF